MIAPASWLSRVRTRERAQQRMIGAHGNELFLVGKPHVIQQVHKLASCPKATTNRARAHGRLRLTAVCAHTKSLAAAE
jgi:hypothetical protein